jgi:hypothetical protein
MEIIKLVVVNICRFHRFLGFFFRTATRLPARWTTILVLLLTIVVSLLRARNRLIVDSPNDMKAT